MEAVISESLSEKQKSSFDMLNRNCVFILLFSDIILSLLINNNINNNNINNIKWRAVTGQLPFFWNKMITQISIKSHFIKIWGFSFFPIRVFFTVTDDSQDSRGTEGAIFYSTLPPPPAQEHSDIYLQR